MLEKSHYELLEVSRSASEDDIREQYRLQLYKVHPDHNPGNEEWAVTQTIALVEAVKELCDPARRKLYDFRLGSRLREEGQTAGMGLFKSQSRKDAEARFAEGVSHYQAERIVPATEAFKQALRLDPGFSDAAYNLALILALHGHHHSALELLAKAIKADPKDEGLSKLKSAINKTYLSL